MTGQGVYGVLLATVTSAVVTVKYPTIHASFTCRHHRDITSIMAHIFSRRPRYQSAEETPGNIGAEEDSTPALDELMAKYTKEHGRLLRLHGPSLLLSNRT